MWFGDLNRNTDGCVRVAATRVDEEKLGLVAKCRASDGIELLFGLGNHVYVLAVGAEDERILEFDFLRVLHSLSTFGAM